MGPAKNVYALTVDKPGKGIFSSLLFLKFSGSLTRAMPWDHAINKIQTGDITAVKNLSINPI